MLKLRLKRAGRKGSPSYRVVIMENSFRRDGRQIDEVGCYNPITKQYKFNLVLFNDLVNSDTTAIVSDKIILQDFQYDAVSNPCLKSDVIVFDKFPIKKKFDPSDTICKELMKDSYHMNVIPESKTLLINTEDFAQLMTDGPQSLISNVSANCNLNQTEAIKEISSFFEDKTLLVQPKGFQKFIYRAGTALQTAGCANLATTTIANARAAGVTGYRIVKTNPVVLLAIPTLFGLGFHGCAALAGNNTIGRVCTRMGNVCNYPMLVVELFYNAYLGPQIQYYFGLPTVLNYTSQVQRGSGFSYEEAVQMLSASKNNSVLKAVKCFVIKKLGGNCD